MKPYYCDDYVTLYHGDCREIVPYLIQHVRKFDLLLTDPPYGIGADNRKQILSRGKLAKATDYGHSDWDAHKPEMELLNLCLSACISQIVWGGNYFNLPPCVGPLVWDKMNGANDFADGELAWNNLGTALRIKRFLWNGMLRAGESRGVVREHPTQKPVELMRWCIGFVPQANTILDPFSGSGTTGRAAKDLRKQCTLIEREEKYCEIAAKRMQQEVLPFDVETKPTITQPELV